LAVGLEVMLQAGRWGEVRPVGIKPAARQQRHLQQRWQPPCACGSDICWQRPAAGTLAALAAGSASSRQ
jgi:hypothetical protein